MQTRVSRQDSGSAADLLLESQADQRIGLDHLKFRRKMLH
jgi:hypothetical protein